MKKLFVALLVLSFTGSAYAEVISGGKRDIFNEGERCGYLTLVTSESSNEFKALNLSSVPVFTFFPAELSTVSGVITLVKQPRSSHIAIKAKDWGIPNADISGADCVANSGGDLEAALEVCFPTIQNGDFVFIKVLRESRELVLEKTTPSDARCSAEVAALEKVEIVADLSFNKIVDHADIGWKDHDKVGSKAANYAELLKAMGSDVVRPGFAIPFYYYNQFLDQNPKIKDAISAILTDKRLNTAEEALYRNEKLEELQAMIMSPEFPMDVKSLELILAKAETFRNTKGNLRNLKFRSSTNAEDLPNFSGAGLYTSKSYKPYNKKGKERSKEDKLVELEEAIKTVWASIWNRRAYDERQLYGIDHSEVYMGIQVNPSFNDELASGVVVTKNIADEKGDLAGVYIEAQRGDEHSVENPAEGVLPERRAVVPNKAGQPEIVRMGNSTVDVDTITILSQESDIPVLTDAHIMDIYNLSLKAETYFKPLLGKDNDLFALDIEFKVDKNDNDEYVVLFKQARPYIIK
ncbi:MAG: PEP/pyruvate-binding domain-containing protein [Bdellovibrionaceae bacterium]|nr:PEP/pyruvate-binding domain-containing protein [Pseudobdellovibrionaceae bacterium]